MGFPDLILILFIPQKDFLIEELQINRVGIKFYHAAYAEFYHQNKNPEKMPEKNTLK